MMAFYTSPFGAIYAQLVGESQFYPTERERIRTHSAAAFVGPAGVTTSTGLPIPANTPVLIPTTGAEPLELFGVVSSSTATVSYLSIT